MTVTGSATVVLSAVDAGPASASGPIIAGQTAFSVGGPYPTASGVVTEGIAVDPATGDVWSVSTSSTNDVDVQSPSGAIVATYPVAASDPVAIVIDPTDHEAFAVGLANNVVSVIDTQTGTTVGEVDLPEGGPSEAAWDPTTDTVVVNSSSNFLQLINASTLAVSAISTSGEGGVPEQLAAYGGEIYYSTSTPEVASVSESGTFGPTLSTSADSLAVDSAT
ncbi:MAG TPA: hypothetical protein VMD59_16100, partial [Acidimicrobiales bacterium]|nr:hypothetical protein [Acidimicrobiales bacterium]